MAKKKSNKRFSRIVNNSMIFLMLVTMVGVIGAFAWNIRSVLQTESTGDGTTIEVSGNNLKNDQYTIGNNPTEINKEYFEQLTADLKSGADDATICADVVKCFITEYYTWTNKDGNYDIGGMQYIVPVKQSNFEDYTLANFYSDMDLYLTQIERENLIEVAGVEVVSSGLGADFTLEIPAEYTESGEENEYVVVQCYDVVATWTYADGSSMDTASIQNQATFRVINDNGRFEIAGIE